MSAYFIVATNALSENMLDIHVGDYNDPKFHKVVRLTAGFLAVTDWEKLLDHYNKHSLLFLLKDPVVRPG